MATTSNCSAGINATYTPASGFFSGQGFPANKSIKADLQSGTAVDQGDLVGATRLTFVASTPQTIDLTTDLKDPTGVAVAFARIKELIFKVVSPTTDGATIFLKQGASNGFTNLIEVTTGNGLKLHMPTSKNDAGLFLLAPNTTGWVVTGTNKTLLLTPSAHAIVLDIIGVGASA